MPSSSTSTPRTEDTDVPSQEIPTYLYLCVLESEDSYPFQFDYSLVTGNSSNKDALVQHKIVDICPCVATEECGQVGLGYHSNHLIDSSQRVLTLIQLAKVKNEDLLREVLYRFDPEEHGSSLSWWCWAMDTLVWQNRTGRILEFSWEYYLSDVKDVAEDFTYSAIVLGKVVEENGGDKEIPVFDMAMYSQLPALACR